MKPTKDVILNSIFLKNRVAELGIKQWWLAEQIGVDRKTVIRWMQGKVKSIQNENAAALAKILNCDLSELTLIDEAEQLASVDEQKMAAQLLASSSLIEKLGPIGEWDVIESLLKATIVPNLPINILGELYNHLTVASWRQSKIDQADIFNRKAEEIARRSNDNALLANALLSKGNLFSWRGQITRAIQTYRECLALESYIDQKTLGSALSNLGATLYESGDLAAGEDSLKKALSIFAVHGNPLNQGIAWCHLSMIYLQMENIDEAKTACEKSFAFAIMDDYRRGIEMAKLVKAEIHARCARVAEAEELLKSGINGFAELKIEEGLNYEFSGRILRLLNKWSDSEQALRHGIELANDFPMYQAVLYFELAQTLSTQPLKKSNAVKAAQTSLALYKKCEAPIREALVHSLIQSIG